MGAEELRASLEQQGRARIAALRREAEAEAERLREQAAAAAARRRAERLGRAEVELRREARARIAVARLAARRVALESRAALLDRVFAQAKQELARALAAPAAGAWLVARVAEALAHLPPGEKRLIASSAVVPALASALEGREDVRVEPDPALDAGFRAVSGDGRVVVEATASSLIEQARAGLAADVLHQLVSGSEAAPGAGP